MADEIHRERKPEATPSAVKSRPAPGAPPSEAEIDSPDRKTLFLLFVIFAVTVGSWGAARFACNMHPPESHGAPKITTDRLLATAKDAAIEFVQRFRSADYEGALETVSGDLIVEMTRAKEDCAHRANECARDREAAAGRLTTAVVLKEDGFFANTRVTTTLKGTTETYLVDVRRDGALWKAVSKTKE
jgi:hypothetical protein